jgi:F0F1-type ATP synthase assembly protein I
MRELAPYASLGMQLVLTIVIFTYIGWWIDGKYDTSPWWLIILTFFGAVAGMVTFLRTVITRNKKNKILKKND